MRHPVCIIFGHRPFEYDYERDHVITNYVECTRCNARKNLTETGWIYE